MLTGDTIAALSSPAVSAARIVLRLSGPDAHVLTRRVCDNYPPSAGAARTRLSFDGLCFPAWVYRFDAPHSYSGEDMVELHLPGNPLLATLLLQMLIRNGARPADPGEFTARAFFNGRMDLSEAEGVATTVSAHSEAELRAGRQLMSGELARRLLPVRDLLAQTLALVESDIDFSDQDIAVISGAEILERTNRADEMLRQLIDESARFERLTHEPRIVLVGRPNAGKSTLLNALAGQERAVVSPIPGTTRDALGMSVALPRGTVRLIDAAGLVDMAGNAIETAMQARARAALAEADLVVLVHACDDPQPLLELDRAADLVVRSKGDLSNDAGEWTVSARTGAHLEELRHRLDELAFGRTSGSTLALNRRHLSEIAAAREALDRMQSVDQPEILALELREALDALGRVVGAVAPDEILGRIFAEFCIGK